MVVVDIRDARVVAVAVKNLDAVQTLSCALRRRAHLDDDFALSSLPDLVEVLPLEQKSVDVDCGTNVELELVGTASGAGLTAQVTVKNDGGRLR